MRNYFVITLVLSLTLAETLADVSSPQDQNDNPEHLDPINDQDQDLTDNNQDKRTICGALNKCNGGITAGNVRHVIVRPSIKHQFVAYAPIVRPVGIRPVVIGGYKYPKPKLHFRLKAPSSYKPAFGGWNPVITSIKPAVQVVKPAAGHVDVIHTKPVPHVDHIHTTPAAVHVDHVHHPVAAPVHVDHVHVQPGHVHLQPGHVHLQPVAVQAAHVDQVHQVTVPHGNHYDTFTHVDHIHQAAVPVAQPVVPVAPPPTVVKPFIPSRVLFEVTRPNLGVLPLGARFPHPILREIPHVHLKPVAPVVPIAPAPVPVAPEPVHQHYHPSLIPHHYNLHGIIPSAAGFSHIAPQPGVSVEYHGTRNFLPLSGTVPFLHQTPVNAVHSLSPTSFGISHAHPHQHLPFEHAQHGFLPTQQLPHDHNPHGFIPQQQLPHNHQAQFSPEHQLPRELSAQFLQNQVQAAQQYQDIPQGQLPLEGEQNFDHFFQSPQEQFSSNSINVQDFNQNNVIQPGQTDVQIPYHLPQHPGWEGTAGFQQQQQTNLHEESRGFGEEVFRPSPQLEPPYKK